MELSGFRLAPNQVGFSEIVVGNNLVTFTKNVCLRLGNPKYVQIFIHDQKRQIVIKACNADEPEAHRFASGNSPQSITWRKKEIYHSFCKLLVGYDPLSDKKAYIEGEYYDNEKLFLFNAREYRFKEERNIM